MHDTLYRVQSIQRGAQGARRRCGGEHYNEKFRLTLLERPKAESASNTMSSCQSTSLIQTPDVRLFLK